MRLFILTAFLTFSAFTAEVKEYTNCRLKNIDFEAPGLPQYSFSCNEGERRFTRDVFNLLAEDNIIINFATTKETFNPGTRNLLFVDHLGIDTLVGFTTPDHFKSLKKVTFNKFNGEVSDYAGNVVLNINKEQLEKSELNNHAGLQHVFHQGNRVVIQRTTDNQYANTISVVENCFPKRCGKTTYLLLRESAIIGSFPSSKAPGQE